MEIDFSKIVPREAYGWMASTIMPRPVAWVSTISSGGVTNLAPFSFFQGVTSNPPVLMFVPVNTRDGRKKDTVVNIESVPEFVVNLVPFSLAEPMNKTAALLPHGESEFSAFAIEPKASLTVKPPRVALAPVAFECRLHSIVPIGEGPLAANVIFGRIQHLHVADSVLGEDGEPDPRKLDLVGRMGGELYTRTADLFSIKRPDR